MTYDFQNWGIEFSKYKARWVFTIRKNTAYPGDALDSLVVKTVKPERGKKKLSFWKGKKELVCTRNWNSLNFRKVAFKCYYTYRTLQKWFIFLLPHSIRDAQHTVLQTSFKKIEFDIFYG